MSRPVSKFSNLQYLFHLLSLESIGFVSAEDEDLAVAEDLAGTNNRCAGDVINVLASCVFTFCGKTHFRTINGLVAKFSVSAIFIYGTGI